MHPAPVQFEKPAVSLHACPALIAPAERRDIDNLTALIYLRQKWGGGRGGASQVEGLDAPVQEGCCDAIQAELPNSEKHMLQLKPQCPIAFSMNGASSATM